MLALVDTLKQQEKPDLTDLTPVEPNPLNPTKGTSGNKRIDHELKHPYLPRPFSGLREGTL